MKVVVAVAAVSLVCAGCATGGDPGASTTNSQAAPSPETTPGCASAATDVATKDVALARLSTAIYESLSCGSEETLDAQLEAATETAQPELAKAGIQVTRNRAIGGMSLSLTHGTSGCQVMVVDSVDSKSLTCMDL